VDGGDLTGTQQVTSVASTQVTFVAASPPTVTAGGFAALSMKKSPAIVISVPPAVPTSPFAPEGAVYPVITGNAL